MNQEKLFIQTLCGLEWFNSPETPNCCAVVLTRSDNLIKKKKKLIQLTLLISSKLYSAVDQDAL